MATTGEQSQVKSRARHQKYTTTVDIDKIAKKDHGFMSNRDAEDVWNKSITEWGLSSADMEDVKTAFAVATLQASSQARDYSESAMIISGVQYNLAVLENIASLYVSGDNPIRVFDRSYNYAEFPMRKYGILSNAANIELRMEAAYRYCCNLTDVPFAFDTSSALMTTGEFWSFNDRQTIASMRAFATDRATMRANDKGERLAIPDSAARSQAKQDTPVSVAESPVRTKLSHFK